MSRRAFSVVVAFAIAGLPFVVGCEKKPEPQKPPQRPMIYDTMTQSIPTGPGKEPDKKETERKETKPSAPGAGTSKVSLESGPGDLGEADFGQKKRLSS